MLESFLADLSLWYLWFIPCIPFIPVIFCLGIFNRDERDEWDGKGSIIASFDPVPDLNPVFRFYPLYPLYPCNNHALALGNRILWDGMERGE